MDRVVAAQAMLLREVTRLAGKSQVDADQDELLLECLEVLNYLGAVRRRQPTSALGSGECGAPLGIGEEARRRLVARLPES